MVLLPPLGPARRPGAGPTTQLPAVRAAPPGPAPRPRGSRRAPRVSEPPAFPARVVTTWAEEPRFRGRGVPAVPRTPGLSSPRSPRRARVSVWRGLPGLRGDMEGCRVSALSDPEWRGCLAGSASRAAPRPHRLGCFLALPARGAPSPDRPAQRAPCRRLLRARAPPAARPRALSSTPSSGHRR